MQALDAQPKTIQKVSFTGNLERVENTKMFFIIKIVKETVLDFMRKTLQVL